LEDARLTFQQFEQRPLETKQTIARPATEASQRPKTGLTKFAQKIRILVADDHAILRQGLAQLLNQEPDIEVIGEAADGEAAVELARKLQPDVILMDIAMPKLSGIEATRVIHNDFPNIRIIGLSMFEKSDRAQAMRAAGAVNYLTKSDPSTDLISAIRLTMNTAA
jgi:DNA-binding NarL/FixJ family response regulator